MSEALTNVERGSARPDWRTDPKVQAAIAKWKKGLATKVQGFFDKYRHTNTPVELGFFGNPAPNFDAMLDAVAALRSDSGPTPDWRRLRDDIIRSVSELEYNSPDDQPNLLQCTVEELSDILEAVLSDSGEAPAPPSVRVPAAGEQG